MTSYAVILYAVLAAAFCVGVGVFYRICARRSPRSAGMRWLIATTVVLALGLIAAQMDLPANARIFAGLVLPVWAIGGLLGLVIAAIRPQGPGA
ncbi:hypothetical protein [Roseovarius dicentrarchi]|uniref:hypothetical protein n=1 Tax=Roseovarius dicentrarchi TaxID=2250573 RepID=UPI000DEBE5BA|nr:hypothetical protein [Roseovarius dicentrarchi]